VHESECPEAPASRQDPVVEVLHGIEVRDPFRWLEDGTSPETEQWIAAQNAYVTEVLGARPEVARMREALREVLETGVEYLSARGASGRIFYLRHDAEESQPKLCVLEGGDERVLLDPSDSGPLTAIDWYHPSPDGAFVALGLSQGGTEDSLLQVLEVGARQVLPDRIPHTRYASVAWLPDGSGFYYTRHPSPGEVPAGEELYHSHVFLHRLGADPKGDSLVFGAGRPKNERPDLRLSEDGSVLWVLAKDGWRRTDVFRLQLGGPPQGVLEGFDATFELELDRGRAFFLTNQGAPNGRIVEVDPENAAEAAWREVVPEPEAAALREFAVAQGRMLVGMVEAADARVFVLDLATGRRTEVELPGMGTVSDVSAGPDGDFLLTFHSFLQAPTIYRVDPATGVLTAVRSSTTPDGVRELAVRKLFYPAKDGVRVPLYIVQRRDLGPGPHPTVLTGYGGFNMVRSSEWSPRFLPWLLKGGVYAVASLRGGGEYGEAWHRAGRLGQKQNVFDDFLAAAEHLLQEGVTDRERLGIFGRSNGGLLMGASLTQRPDLFSAVVCGVPLLDMLRYDRFRMGAFWTVEYGSPTRPEDFAWLHAYSPYHHVRPGVRYPPTYIYAARDDVRVDPLHARKMAALLQETTRGAEGACILMRTEFDAGHGVGKPVAAVIEEQQEIWGFFAWRLGLRV